MRRLLGFSQISKTLLLLGITSLAYLPFAHAANNGCEAVFETETVLPQAGPHHQKIIKKNVGTGDLYGTTLAVKFADHRTASAADVLKTLAGESSDKIIVAGSTSGSLTRPILLDRTGDLDFEGLLVVRLEKPGFEALSNPDSAEIKNLATFLQNHIETVIAEHSDYRFIELKAGEFHDIETGEWKGIKWDLKDVRKGWKHVVDRSGSRFVTLEQVLVSDARIKADWAVPAVNETPISNSYTEASVVYRIAGKVGNNQIRLRPATRGDGLTLPIRATSIAMDEVALETLRQASVATGSTPVEHVHQIIMDSVKKYMDHDELKVLKRVFSLLQFWEDVPAYNELTNNRISQESLLGLFQSLLTDHELLELGQLRSKAELLHVLSEKNIKLPEGVQEHWLKELKKRFHIKETSIESILAELTDRIHTRIAVLEKDYTEVRDFTNWVLSRVRFIDGELTPKPLFMAMKPNAKFQQAVERRLKSWQEKYPHLRFDLPSDLHMTVRFLGQMTPSAAKALESMVSGIGDGASFENGGAHIFGRNFQVLSILYSPNARIAPVIKKISSAGPAFGAVKENFSADEFVPHVTLAHIDLSSPQSKMEAERFLMDENLDEFNNLTVSGTGLWTRSQSQSAAEPQYEKYKPNP